MAGMVLEGLTKTYADGFTAVQDLNLTIEDGEFVVLVGPSGCGKSTTLRMIAGLETIDGGVLRIGDRVVNAVRPKDRDIAMVFQNYALYPHLTAAENMGFSLRMNRIPKQDRIARVQEAAELLGLEPILDKKPGQLSGGQRQRVALGRAIVRKPAAFLFDEPLSNLDPDRRVSTRAEIRRIQRDLGTTTVYVTHDHEEAMALGDKIIIMNEGKMQQADRPEEVYENPKNVFVGTFLGTPRMNALPATLRARDGTLCATATIGQVEVEIPIHRDRVPKSLAQGDRATLGIRPHCIEIAACAQAPPPWGITQGEIVDVELLGFATDLVVGIGGHELRVRTSGDSKLSLGDAVRVRIPPQDIHVFAN